METAANQVIATEKVIPQSQPDLGEAEAARVLEVVRSGWLTQGEVAASFEGAFAQYVGAPHAIFVNSGTSALFLALKSLGINAPEDEVLVPALTFTASASTIVHAGGTPVFVDVDPETLCIDPQDALAKRTPRTRAVMTVHLAGREAPRTFGDLPVVEDSAHRVLPNDWRQNLMCFSFYPTKNMTTGEGGMMLLGEEAKAAWLRRARLHGFSKDGWRRYHATTRHWQYAIEFLGWKMNGTDMGAAIGLVQLEKLAAMNARRDEIVAAYNQAFGLNRQGNHLFLLLVKNPDQFVAFMGDHNIRCMRHFVPLHLQPGYQAHTCSLPVTERLAENLISLPLYPGLTDEECQRVIDAVKKNPHW